MDCRNSRYIRKREYRLWLGGDNLKLRQIKMSDIPIQKMPLFSRNVKIVVLSLFIFAISAGSFWSFNSGK